MRSWSQRTLLLSSVALAAAAVPGTLHAQDNASLTGIVTDATGAVVSHAVVTLVNPARGIDANAKTDKDGSYRFPNVPPAPGYRLTVKSPGFSDVIVNDVSLNVGITQTQNVTMTAGSSVTVEIESGNKSVTLNTTDASIGNNIDMQLVNDLPVQSRNGVAPLLVIQPGVTNSGAVTGARTDQTSLVIDGLDVNDLSTGQFGNSNGGIPVDAVQEFRGTVAGLPANIGTGSGGQFQLVTKSGTNKFHGNVNEYHRDTATASNLWFNNNSTVVVPRTPLIRNQFGGNIGGPVLKDKLFFFADFYNSRIVSSLNDTTVDIVPLDSFRNGNISYVKNTAGCSAATTRQNNPASAACIGTVTPTQVKSTYDPALIGEDATIFNGFAARYPHANDLTLGDGINTGGFRFTQSTLNVVYDGVAKVDYNLTNKERLFVQFHEAHQDSVQSINRFAGDPLTRPFSDRSYGYVASLISEFGNNKVNQFYFGDNVTVFSFGLTYNPSGASYLSSFGPFTAPYDDGNIQRRRVPIPVIRDDFNWVKGRHNIGFGGTFKFIKSSNFLGSDYNAYTIGLGGNISALNAALRPTDISTSSTYYSQWDAALPLALGRVGRVSSIYNFNAAGQVQPQNTGANRRYRYYQTELYMGDTWQFNKQLTFTYGVRYQLDSVPYETLGAQSQPNIGFDAYYAQRVTQSRNAVSGNAAVPFVTYNLGGAANNAAPIYNPNYKDVAPRFAFSYNPTWAPKTVFNGSAALVYDRSVTNAINFLQNQNTFLFQNSVAANYGTSGDAATSLKNDPRIGGSLAVQQNGTLGLILPAPPTVAAPAKPYTPYVTAAGVPTGLAGGNSTLSIDPNLKDPYNITFNAGVQQDFGHGFILRTNYVGRLGRRLLAYADASQLIDFADTKSNQMLSAAFAGLTTQVRGGTAANAVAAQPWFENVLPAGYGAARNCGTVRCTSNTAYIAYNYTALASYGDITDILQGLASGGILPANIGLASQFAVNRYETNKASSNYHGLLTTLSKNMSNGLKFDLNYTWSHSIDNYSLIANATGYVCDAANLRACRGNSDFDVQQITSADVIYQLPFGRGRQFGSSSHIWLDELIGGWNVSALPIYQTGSPYSATTSAYLASYGSNDPAIYDGSRTDDVRANLHKDSLGRLQNFNDATKALSHFRGPIGIEYGSRNVLRGPGQFFLDAGLSKNFQILPDNRLKAVFRADGFNVLNHPTFSTPNASIVSSTFGQTTAATAATGSQAYRVGQFSLRLEF